MSGEATMSAWSPARVALLRLHHALGLSAAVSAELIGEVSRNAVISKRRRLGLVGVCPVAASSRTTSGGSSGARNTWLSRLFWTPPGGASIARAPLPCMDFPPPPHADPKPLTGRRARQCAWPLGPATAPGDYRTLFCCAPTERGRSFCGVHHALAYPEPDEPEEGAGCRV